MRLVKLNTAALIIRACYTEDKLFCLANGGSSVLFQAIDKCVADEVAKVTASTEFFKVEMSDGRLAGFAILTYGEIASVVDSFLRPVMRVYQDEFNSSINGVVNSILKPVV